MNSFCAHVAKKVDIWKKKLLITGLVNLEYAEYIFANLSLESLTHFY